MVQRFGFQSHGFGNKIQVSGFRIPDSGFRVSGFGVGTSVKGDFVRVDFRIPLLDVAFFLVAFHPEVPEFAPAWEFGINFLGGGWG